GCLHSSRPVDRSQSRTVSLCAAETRCFPPGKKAKKSTAPGWRNRTEPMRTRALGGRTSPPGRGAASEGGAPRSPAPRTKAREHASNQARAPRQGDRRNARRAAEVAVESRAVNMVLLHVPAPVGVSSRLGTAYLSEILSWAALVALAWKPAGFRQLSRRNS